MAKFQVKLSALVNAEVTIVVDASSKEDAEELAYSNNPDIYQWKLVDVYEVTGIEADSLVLAPTTSGYIVARANDL